MSKVTILVGAQWGDEGKGKWIDILAEQKDIVVRYQGGNNAGHTLYVSGEKVVLHQIPSGIFQNKTVALSAGVVINPGELVKEIEKVRPFGKLTASNLWLSARAHIITPWHIYMDSQKEQTSENPIGTTKRGIGPTYAEKANRTGLRLGDFIVRGRREAWMAVMEASDARFSDFVKNNVAAWEEFTAAADFLEGFVCDAESRLRQSIREGKSLLLEGAQGALLDIDHGTYPYVTSSPTAAGGAMASIGIAPRSIDKIYGVAKAYLTRVGAGPFPTELFDDAGKTMAEKGKEFGATTGRARRCGWLDAVALRYCAEVSGMDGIILNKMDILSGFDEIKIAFAYEHPRLGTLKEFPWSHQILSECKPVYASYPGWSEDISSGITQGSDLPENARKFIAAVSEKAACKVSHVGVGVHRESAIYL